MKYWHILLGLVAAAVAVVALYIGDWQAQQAIIAELSKNPTPLGPLHSPYFLYARDVGVWCGPAQTRDQQTAYFFATYSDGRATVRTFPNGALPEWDGENQQDARYLVCRRTGQPSILNTLRLMAHYLKADLDMAEIGPARVRRVILNDQKYVIPEGYVWGRLPAASEPATVESNVLVEGRMPDFAPGSTHDASGYYITRSKTKGFGDTARGITHTIKSDLSTIRNQLRAIFSESEVVSQRVDRDDTHTLYRDMRLGDQERALTDVYVRISSGDWTVCHHTTAPYPDCQLNVVDGSIHHQITFGAPWLSARWQLADNVRAKWASWKMN